MPVYSSFLPVSLLHLLHSLPQTAHSWLVCFSGQCITSLQQILHNISTWKHVGCIPLATKLKCNGLGWVWPTDRQQVGSAVWTSVVPVTPTPGCASNSGHCLQRRHVNSRQGGRGTPFWWQKAKTTCWQSNGVPPSGATLGVTVSMSAFLACHQCNCAGWLLLGAWIFGL